jgi:hypothetical protein
MWSKLSAANTLKICLNAYKKAVFVPMILLSKLNHVQSLPLAWAENNDRLDRSPQIYFPPGPYT